MAFAESSGNGVFDEAASHRAHYRLREPRHRAAVDKRARIQWVLWGLERDAREALALAYAPVGAERATHPLREAFARGAANLLELALRSPAVSDAFARAHGIDEPREFPRTLVLRWLETDVRSGKGRACASLARRAELAYGAALEAYSQRMVERIVAARTERTAYYAAIAANYALAGRA
jgi:hypothetical protein